MNQGVDLKTKSLVFSRYIGQSVWIEEIYKGTHKIGVLTGIRTDAIQLKIGESLQWITLQQEPDYFNIRLLLQPLSRLTNEVKETANSLPVTVFITQYYIQLGFDMPVFISPGHPLNCKYASELGLADYRSPTEILALNKNSVASAAAGGVIMHY